MKPFIIPLALIGMVTVGAISSAQEAVTFTPPAQPPSQPTMVNQMGQPSPEDEALVQTNHELEAAWIGARTQMIQAQREATQQRQLNAQLVKRVQELEAKDKAMPKPAEPEKK